MRFSQIDTISFEELRNHVYAALVHYLSVKGPYDI